MGRMMWRVKTGRGGSVRCWVFMRQGGHSIVVFSSERQYACTFIRLAGLAHTPLSLCVLHWECVSMLTMGV
jgi:hypothetical protein